MKKILMMAAAAALLAIGSSAQAQIVWSGTASMVVMGESPIAVNYFVYLSGGTYTYAYEFDAPVALGEFEVNVGNGSYISSVLASGVNTISTIASANSATLGATLTSDFTTASTTYTTSSVGSTSVQWQNNPSATEGDYAFGFTSRFGPTPGSGSIIDDTVGPWGDNSGGNPIPVPAPVPEASTVMAGALMLLPLGIGAVRALRKERTA
jgi:hypothetical protein